MTFRLSDLNAREVLDSRGRPTLSVQVRIGHAWGQAAVPAGASTGSGEAVELRDHEPARYAGAGVQRAVASVRSEIADVLCTHTFQDLADVDAALCQLDGTPNKSRLGSNAVVGVSMATARAIAQIQQIPLFAYLKGSGASMRLPVPCFNVLNGGAHAANSLEFQEFMLAPTGAPSLTEAVRAGAEIYTSLKELLGRAQLSTGIGDEGGYAPRLDTPEQACEYLVSAIEAAGYHATREGVVLAIDPAATGFCSQGHYQLGQQKLSDVELVERYAEMTSRFPIWSLEDGMAEDDHNGWVRLHERLGDQLQIVGDDLLVTDPARIRYAAEHKLANAALIKLNQVGTVTETQQALQECRDVGWAAMISHRSGETTDDFIADLAVGSGCGQIKAGAPARGERVAKYNRLMAIQDQLRTADYGLPTR